MNKRIIVVFFLFVSVHLFAQAKTVLPPLDKSPMDMSYYPAGYPLLKIQGKMVEPLKMRIIYGRPQLNGRRAFGEIRELKQIWRLGANEATEIEFFKDVRIDGKKVKKGRYTMYCIPDNDKWTMIINKETDTWGDFGYDSTKDVLRVDVPTVKQSESTESLTIVFEKSATGANMVTYWDDIKTSLPITF